MPKLNPEDFKPQDLEPQYFQSNIGLGYGELVYFLHLKDNQYMCVGSTIYRGESSFELGEIVYTSPNWQDMEKDGYIMENEIEPTNTPNIQVSSHLISYILEQEKRIKQIEKFV